MARTANRRQKAIENTVLQEKVDVIYKTAIYVRLSREDNLKGSDSIDNQIAVLKSYIQGKSDLSLVAVFEDNGFTGTDFNRPGWQEMMEKVKAGEVNCIIVKDLSRLGRNYIETGEFLEKICPFFGIRFIAVNDGFDTNTAEANGQLSVSLSNIINDYYAKDISRKVSTALRNKMEHGEYIGSWEKYGYLKSPENKNLLIVNPETAPIVQMIYQWRSEGMSYMGINKKLNDMGVPSPSQYKADRGIVTNSNQKAKIILWNKHMVTDILKDIVYLGHLAQRKTAQCLYAGIPTALTDEQDWIVVKNTHEPIISEELFEKVQVINQKAVATTKANHGKYDYLPKEKNIYGKKFTCADCGSIMKLIRSFSTKKDKVYHTFKCPTYCEHGVRGCNAKKMRKADLDEAVLTTIKSQFDLFLDMQEALHQLISMKKVQIKQSGQVEEANSIKKKLEQKKGVFSGLYSDFREGLLSQEDYAQTREVLMEEINKLEKLLEETTGTKKKMTNNLKARRNGLIWQRNTTRQKALQKKW